MSKDNPPTVRIFDVKTRFQELARRPGGVPRSRAVEHAQDNLGKIKPELEDWLDRELKLLAAVLPQNPSNAPDTEWVQKAAFHSRQLRDAGATIGLALVSFVADALCEMLEAVEKGGSCSPEMITCHLEALLLAVQEPYRSLGPDQLPELSGGLRRVVELASLPLAPAK